MPATDNEFTPEQIEGQRLLSWGHYLSAHLSIMCGLPVRIPDITRGVDPTDVVHIAAALFGVEDAKAGKRRTRAEIERAIVELNA